MPVPVPVPVAVAVAVAVAVVMAVAAILVQFLLIKEPQLMVIQAESLPPLISFC